MEKLLVDSELKALRSQLNPHFIQNTFDLMAQQVRDREPEESGALIGKISGYLRQGLNKSDKNRITLEEELEYTEEYMKVQQMIKPGLFEYAFIIDGEADTIGIMVPSMMLQPVVENCIKHGFRKGATNGMIEIEVIQNGDRLSIAIRDNGIGLQNISGKFSENSKGIELTRKRIEAIYKRNKKEDVIIKLQNRSDGVTGTEFLIKFSV